MPFTMEKTSLENEQFLGILYNPNKQLTKTPILVIDASIGGNP